MKKPKILFYDIETLPLKARVWDTGKHFISHKNLLPGYEMWDLICIQYCWNDDKPVKVLRWDKHGGTKRMLQTFDKLVRKADHCIGKNSDRFDLKILNSLRMLHKLPGIPEWNKYCDDLEKQMRRYFRLPSQSLDYISKACGIGGKNVMCMQDWVDIQDHRDIERLRASSLKGKELNVVAHHLFKKTPTELRRAGKEAMEKMCTYGAKDTEDTRTLWFHLEEHFEPRFNQALFQGHDIGCKACGSENMKKNGTRISGKTKYQYFLCRECHYTGTRAPISKNGKIGRSG